MTSSMDADPLIADIDYLTIGGLSTRQHYGIVDAGADGSDPSGQHVGPVKQPTRGRVMTTKTEDPIRDAAEQVANSLSQRGYAFVEEDMIEPLTATLRAFLQTAGIPLNTASTPNPASPSAS